MAKKKSKEASIGFAVGKSAVERLKTDGPTALDTSQIVVRSGNRVIGGPAAGGYETRIWEKVTCRVADPILDPEEIITNPERFGIQFNATKTPAAAIGAKKAAKKAK